MSKAQVTYSFTMDANAIGKAMPNLLRRGKQLKEDLHKVLVSILFTWNKTGDVRPVLQYCNEALNVDTYAGQAITDWFGAFGGLTYDPKVKGFAYTDTVVSAENVGLAAEKPYWEFKPPKDIKPWDLSEALRNLIQLAQSKAKKGGEGINVPKAMLDQLIEVEKVFTKA
jgi:hypothetical protein